MNCLKAEINHNKECAGIEDGALSKFRKVVVYK